MIGERPRAGDCAWPAFTPARILQVDIGQPLPGVLPVDPRTDRGYRRAVSYVRLHTQLLGVVETPLPEGGLNAHEYARQIWSALGQQITEHLGEDGMPAVSALSAAGVPYSGRPRCLKIRDRLLVDPPFVSVVVATRDRPDRLAVCLRSLLSLEYPSFEIIVVDNAPRTAATVELVRAMAGGASAEVRYAREDQTGLSSARNRGLSGAKGEVIAFTDDDVVVDEHWLSHLVAGFRRANDVACVTGNILPMELETPAQFLFEQFGGFSKGYTRRIYDLADHRVRSPLYPYAAGTFGSGANLAFNTRVLQALGGFDPSLSTGTPARGGEDLAAFVAIITRGSRLVYEPAAIVYHHHHRDYAGLRKQVYGYGVGLTAYVTKCVLDDPRRFIDVLGRLPYGLWFAMGGQSPKNRGKAADYPHDLTRAELLGMAYGPFAYLRSRWQGRTRFAASTGRQSG